MARYKPKHYNQQTINFSNLMGGLFLASNPESIPDNCLARADNVEYGVLLNQLQTVPGVNVLSDIGGNGGSLWYDELHSVFLFNVGQNLYFSTDGTDKILLGTLTGIKNPVFCLYGDYVLIASGGQIQQFNGTTLYIVLGSPLSHAVAHRRGRVLAYNINSDVLNYSAIGDHTNWVNTPSDPSSSQFADVGYKDSSLIACVIPLSSDLIVIKTSGVAYRVVSEEDFANLTIVEGAQKAYAGNQFSGVGVLNHAYFVGREGFNSFSTVQEYGAIKLDEPSPGSAINTAIIRNVDQNSQVWHVTSRKQIWVKAQNDNSIYIYHYLLNSWTKRKFQFQISDVAFKGHDVYIVYGSKIAKLDDTIAKDNNVDIVSKIATKSFTPQLRAILLKKVVFDIFSINAGQGLLQVGDKVNEIFTINPATPLAINDSVLAYSNTRPSVSSTFDHKYIRRSASLKYLNVRITVSSGSMAIRNISVDKVEV